MLQKEQQQHTKLKHSATSKINIVQNLNLLKIPSITLIIFFSEETFYWI